MENSVKALTIKDYKNTVEIALPCSCDAPIAYTSTYPDPDCEEGDECKRKVGLSLFKLDLRNNKSVEVYNDIPFGADQDNLDMICTRCGKSWVAFNQLFF